MSDNYLSSIVEGKSDDRTPLRAMDVRRHRARAVHDRARQPRRHHGPAGDQGRPRRVAGAARVDRQRVHPRLRRPPPHRRRARRPLRAKACLPHGADHLHGRVGGSRARSLRRPHRGRSGDPGNRRRDRHAAHADAPVRGRAAGAPWAGARRLGRHLGPRDRDRPAGGRRDHPGSQLALDLLAQRPDRDRGAGDGLDSTHARAGARPRASTCPAWRSPRAACSPSCGR